MENKPALTVILSFYKNVEFLKNVLDSILNQSFRDFELIISDDGSPENIVFEVKKLLNATSLNYQYNWHEDIGFRKTTILNKSVVASKSDYLVFIDGDCLVHHHFLLEHYNGRKKGFVRSGRRVLLTENVTKNLNPEKISSKYFEYAILYELLRDSTKNGIAALEQGIYIKSRILRFLLSNKDRGILGCNFSMYKEDLLRMNGFDERFVKPGVGEDSDLQARIRRTSDIHISSITKRAIVYHQYHKTLKREPDIYDIYHQNNKAGITFTPFGIKKIAESEEKN
jgi:glycosyltransferase involved in cell wall biosynthesis